ncbi:MULTISPECIES: transglutaminase family protein [Paenibacillus]|uniref:transglutaminase family protein n=1 Tax=Paenibacillus TaxID=44249 RepID=UPI0022B8D64C|nr:transglutaminase family protein [Paenibacillus caseinilyticus]MCZ8522927.1 transglutaminase family protein [Paenibacillus caseinilyticus]
MKIEISHVTRYTYEDQVTDSVNEIRLTPRTNDRQSCFHHEVRVEPGTPLFTYEDYFGNRVHSFSVHQPHRELIIHVKATVTTMDRHQGEGLPQLPLHEQLALLAGEEFQNRYIEYLLPTGYTEETAELRAYAARYPLEDAGLYPWVKRLTRAIHSELTYDPSVTSVHTTALETLKLKRGVCQDYAHLMIAICRSRGLPARYVSGYHFVGDLSGGSADFEQASHAWVEVHIPGTGWLGFDPTNNAEAGWRYIKLGHGRDYADIVPVKGVYRGTGRQKLDVSVDVRRLGEEEV